MSVGKASPSFPAQIKEFASDKFPDKRARLIDKLLDSHQKIKASTNNMLGKVLAAYSEDDKAVRAVYLRTLARRPTDREANRVREHIRSVGNRAEAFEDVLWALINSTEFQLKR